MGTKAKKGKAPSTDTSSGKAVEVALRSIENTHGTYVKWLRDYSQKKLEVVSTGSLGLDLSLISGGLVKGRLVEVYGKPSCGKSSLALSAASSVTKSGGLVLYVDLEHALTPSLAMSFGIDPDKLIVVQPYSGEEALDVMRTMIETSNISMCVLDSVASLVPQAELDGDFGTSLMGHQAKLVSRLCRDFVPLIGRTNTLLVVINQTRANLGTYGSSEVTTGGKSIPFYSSHRIKVSYVPGPQSAYLIRDQKGNVIGHRALFTVVKNKFGAAYGSSEATLYYGKGFSLMDEIVDIAVEVGIIEKKGAWYVVGENKLQGKHRVTEALEEDPKLKASILEELGKTLNISLEAYFERA